MQNIVGVNDMINLRLAEYNRKTKEFIRFLSLDKYNDEEASPTFSYSKDYIQINWYDYPLLHKDFKEEIFELDKKDPLNRFDGLFDGRTYGEGRFVLIAEADSQPNIIRNLKSDKYIRFPFLDDVVQFSYCDENDDYYIEGVTLVKEGQNYKLHEDSYVTYDGVWFELVGNLHENPELYEKIK